MTSEPIGDNDETPEEVDFSKGVRGLHSIPPGSKVLMPVFNEEELLKRDIEMDKALK
jgi:hypothetical protein